MKRIIMALFSILIPLLIFNGCSSGRSVDLKNYFDVTFRGVNGKSSGMITVDHNGLDKALTGSGELSDEQELALLGLIMSFDYKIEPEEGLSNGDNVLLSITYSEEYAKKLKLNIQGAEQAYKVEGLKDAVTVDLFKDVEVSFSGTSPFAEVAIKNKSSDLFLSSVTFSPSANGNLKAGDKLTVTANYDEALALECGYVVENATRNYAVDNVESYVQQYSSIDSDTIENLRRESIDLIESQLAKDKDFMLKTAKKIIYDSYNKSFIYSEKLCS